MMHPFALAIGGALLVWTFLQFAHLVSHFRRVYTSPLRTLRGPRDRPSWLFGHTKPLMMGKSSELELQWQAQYGSTFAFRSIAETLTLHTTDPRALSHILFASDETWWKPERLRAGLTRFLGRGILVTEGEEHKMQRKVMNPAFRPDEIRNVNDIFLAKSAQLRDVLNACIAANPSQQRIDMLSWLSKATLDIIGLAGFDYTFNALNETGQPSKLQEAFDTLLRGAPQSPILLFLLSRSSLLRRIPTRRQKISRASKAMMMQIGRDLLAEKKAALGAEGVKGKAAGARDLLSVLLKANMSEDVPPEQRLSDEDVIAQVPTFLFAGHETTSNSMTWCLFELSKHADMQSRLRTELLAVPTDAPSADALSALPYLDAVVRETLRLHPVVASLDRQATRADVLPLSQPIVDRRGVTRSEIHVAKGDVVRIPITMVNRSKDIWGPDAFEFNPERWASVPSDAKKVPGVLPGLLTFIGGPRACIGWRFSVLEMKALLFHLVRGFQFELAVPAEHVTGNSSGLSRPSVRGETTAQMPMFLTPVQEL